MDIHVQPQNGEHLNTDAEYLGTDKQVNRTQPLVSVCIETYQQKNYIKKCIEGVLMQKTDFPIEIIIGEDESTDGTRDICKAYAKEFPDRIRLFLRDRGRSCVFDENGNRIFGYNGIWTRQTARGKYVALCEGDDYWTDPLKLQKQLSCLRENNRAVASITNAMLVNEDTQESRLYHSNRKEGFLNHKVVMLAGGGAYATASLFYEREKLHETTIYSNIESFHDTLAVDTILIYALSEAGEIYYIDEVMSVYRRWSGGIYSSVRSDEIAYVRLKERQLRGLLKLRHYVDTHRKKLIKKKISKEALEVIRISAEFNRFKYLKYLTLNAMIKLLFRYKR